MVVNPAPAIATYGDLPVGMEIPARDQLATAESS